MSGTAPSRRPRASFPAVVGLGWAVVVPLAAAVCLRLARLDHLVPMVAVNALTPWVYLPAYAAVGVALATRSRPLLAVALVVVVAHLAWSAPDLGLGGTPPEAGGSPQLRLLTANLFEENAQLSSMARSVLDVDADVVLLQEVQPQHVQALDEAGVPGRYPYALVQPRADQFGAAIYSRLPLTDTDGREIGGSLLLGADVEVGDQTVRLYVVHTKSPVTRDGLRRWTEQLEAIDAAIARSLGNAAVVAAGDFNANRHHRTFRALTEGPMEEAHDVRGRGHARTWPTGWVFPPLMRLDHVLVSPEVTVLAVSETVIPGSDHLGIVADLAVTGYDE